MFRTRRRHRRLGRRSLAGLALLLIFHLAVPAHANPWELAFCAPVGAWPMSDQDRPGFDNAIAEILADELGATATFTWTNFDEVGIRDTLHAGLCDVAVGIGEGVGEVLSTVPYLKTPYVFVTRTDRGLNITSLDDPQLTTLAIGTYQAGIPSIALRNRGIVDNVREYASIIRPAGVDDHTPILDAVLAGEVDVGIVYGPVAAARADEEGGSLRLEAVTPEVDFGDTILQLSRIWTIGVRPHDEALRDRLNLALAARWDDVVAVLDAYAVPQMALSRPLDIEEDPDSTRVGVIYPARTPASLQNAPIGDAMRLGRIMAENTVALLDDPEAPFVVLDAHAPTLEAAERAAQRLIHADGVDALVGGYDPAEARALARIAAEHEVAFFDIGSEEDALRDARCYPTALHVAPSGSMVVDATIQTLPGDDAPAVFAVAERDTAMEVLPTSVQEGLQRHGGTLVGSALVDPGQFIYFPVFDAIRSSGADTVLLLMDPDAQEFFLGQAAAMNLGVRFVGLSTVRGQSRPYLQRYLQVAPGLGATPRMAVWDPALPTSVNEAFAARTSEPMEPVAWTTYAAILSMFAAAEAGVVHDTDALLRFLTEPTTQLDVGKETPARYRAADRQMLQDLYLVEVVPDAPWGRTAAARIATARVVGTVPLDATAAVVGGTSEECGAP